MQDASNIPFYMPWITNEDRKAVQESLKSQWLTGGPKAIHFEKMFADYTGVKHAISVSSCTAALHLAMRVLNIKPGNEVIVPVLTFAATANAPIFCGAKPVFADIDERTYNISPEDLENKITRKTKAIIVVHYAGQPCDMKEIMEIAEDNKLWIVEDCAWSTGAEYAKRKTGSLGAIGCFSFYPTKNMTTFEGGMVTTSDDKKATKIRLLRGQGMTKTAFDREREATWYYDVVDLGYNYRLNEVQAAIGITQLSRIEDINRRRIRVANYYTEKLKKIDGIVPPYEAEDRTHIYSLYVIRVVEENFGMTRDNLFEMLSSKGIGLSVHYTPLHLLTFYRKLSHYELGDFPIAEKVYEEILTLPSFPTMTKKQIHHVVEEIKSTSC